MAEDALAGLLGIDPEQLKGLLASLGPTQEMQAQADKQKWLTAGLGILAARPGNVWNAVGQGGLLGVQAGQDSLKQQLAQRGQDLGQVGALMDMRRRAQLAQQFAPPPSAGIAPQQSPPQFGMQDRGMGMPPQQPQQEGAGGPIFEALRNLGASPQEIAVVAQSKDPAAAAMELFKEYSKPVMGQGNIPMLRGRNGFQAMPATGYNEALGAQTQVTEQAKASQDLVDVPMGDGTTAKVPRDIAVKYLGAKFGGQLQTPQPAANATFSFKNATLPQVQAAVADAQGLRAGGGFGTTPDPIAMRAAEANAGAMAQVYSKQHEKIDADAEAAGTLRTRLAQMNELLGQFSPNMGAPMRQKIAEVGQAMGLPQETINAAAGGDLAAMQEFRKHSVQMAFEAARTQMGGVPRAWMELKVQLEANPSTSLTPQADKAIMAFMDGMASRAQDKQQARDAWLTSHPDLKGFEGSFATQHPPSAYLPDPKQFNVPTKVQSSAAGASGATPQQIVDELRKRGVVR